MRRLIVLLVLCGPLLAVGSTFPVDTAVPAAADGPAGGTLLYLPLLQNQPTYTYYWPLVSVPLQLPKQGIGSPYSDCDLVLQTGAHWYYDWSARPSQCWGEVQAHAMIWGAFETLPELPWYVSHVHGGNECDLPQQCGIAAKTYARLWRQIELAYPDTPKIAPAPSPWGRQWLLEVVAEYRRLFDAWPQFDGGLAAHCYFATAEECMAELAWYKQKAQEWGAPGVWVTEWAILPCSYTSMGVPGQPSISAALQEADQLRRALTADPDILGHAWFADYIRNEEQFAFQPVQCDTSLFDGSGYLTAFGLWYGQ